MGLNIKPLGARVIVAPLEKDVETFAGGQLVLPDTAKEKPQQGKVTAAGKGKILENGEVLPLTVKKGDRILFGKYAGTDIKIDGEEHLIMREDDILGVIKK